MDKAIKILKALLEPDAEDRIDFNDSSLIAGKSGSKEWVYIAEALAKLQAHKAKIESLKELCSEKSKILDDVVIKTKYQTLAVKAASNKAIYDEILQKLEELDK